MAYATIVSKLLSLGEIVVSDSAYSYTFIHSVVCLSVCHIHAPCLNRLMDSYAIWQRHTELDGGSLTPRKGRLGGVKPTAKTCSCKLLLPPGEYKGSDLPTAKLVWFLWLSS